MCCAAESTPRNDDPVQMHISRAARRRSEWEFAHLETAQHGQRALLVPVALLEGHRAHRGAQRGQQQVQALHRPRLLLLLLLLHVLGHLRSGTDGGSVECPKDAGMLDADASKAA